MTIRDMAINHLRTSGFPGIGFPDRPDGQTPSIRPPVGGQSIPQTNQNIRNAASEISDAFDILSGPAAEFQGNSADANVATVQVDNNLLNSTRPPQDFTINVQQTATAQTHVGENLTAVSSNAQAGTHAFEIEMDNGATHRFEIQVSENDDNATVQRSMAVAINDADIGITASIATGTEDGAAASALTIAASQTGTDSAFVIRDVGENSQLVSAMGVGGNTEASQAAQNAVFSVNGVERESQSNEVNISAGINATLTGAGETEVTFGRSAEQAMAAARDLVNAINSAIRETNPNDGRGSARFMNDLIGANITFAPSLGRMGIEVLENGQLAIDETRLQAAVENGTFENNSGFASRMERISSNALNTRHYANAPPPVNMNLNNFDFGNTADPWGMMNLFA